MSPEQPTAWSLYIGTDDADALAQKVQAAGGQVLMPPFDVGDQGRMAVFADPGGAAISAWQPIAMGGFQTQGSNAFGWAELNARGVDRSLEFYREVFGWDPKSVGSDEMPYTEFQVDGQSIAGATEMSQMAPAGDAELLAGLLRCRRCRRGDQQGRRGRRQGRWSRRWTSRADGCRSSADPQGAIFGLMHMTS